jgi:hypothetical protein
MDASVYQKVEKVDLNFLIRSSKNRVKPEKLERERHGGVQVSFGPPPENPHYRTLALGEMKPISCLIIRGGFPSLG